MVFHLLKKAIRNKSDYPKSSTEFYFILKVSSQKIVYLIDTFVFSSKWMFKKDEIEYKKKLTCHFGINVQLLYLPLIITNVELYSLNILFNTNFFQQ